LAISGGYFTVVGAANTVRSVFQTGVSREIPSFFGPKKSELQLLLMSKPVTFQNFRLFFPTTIFLWN